jgi:hypothetical protein
LYEEDNAISLLSNTKMPPSDHVSNMKNIERL